MYQEQFFVYERLERLGATCYSWGSQLEADYPNLVDIQHRYALLAQTPGYNGIGLSRVADKLGLPQKQGFDDFAHYTGNSLSREAIQYAVRDVTLPEMIRHMFAPAEGYQTVVRCGQMDYRLSEAQALWWPMNDRDVTWCSSPQTMTYSHLESLISATCGEPMVIVDLGAGEDLSKYSRVGNCCVAQALAFAV